MRIKLRTGTSRLAVTAVGAVVLVVSVAACGKAVNAAASTTPSPSASASAAASAKAAVSANWQEFFSGATSAARKIGLLQNGQQFAQTIRAQAASAIAKATRVKITSITVTSPTTATVTYDIMANGQTVLPNQKGQAVLQSGVWKVSAQSFQNLLKLEQGQGGASASPSPSTSP